MAPPLNSSGTIPARSFDNRLRDIRKGERGRGKGTMSKRIQLNDTKA